MVEVHNFNLLITSIARIYNIMELLIITLYNIIVNKQVIKFIK